MKTFTSISGCRYRLRVANIPSSHSMRASQNVSSNDRFHRAPSRFSHVSSHRKLEIPTVGDASAGGAGELIEPLSKGTLQTNAQMLRQWSRQRHVDGTKRPSYKDPVYSSAILWMLSRKSHCGTSYLFIQQYLSECYRVPSWPCVQHRKLR